MATSVRSKVYAAVAVLEEGAAQKYAPQLQHNMWVVAARNAVLSVITGGGKWVEIKVHSDPLYQHLILTAERKFWRCVENGEPPNSLGRAAKATNRSCSDCRYDLVQCVGGTRSSLFADPSGTFEHEQAKIELKSLVPEDAQQAIGHGVRAKRSEVGAISFDLLAGETDHASV